MPEQQNTVANTENDPTLRFTELKIGKHTYKLVFDFDGMARAEALTGLSLMLGVNFAALKLRELRGMLLGSMLRAHPDMTLDKVTALLRNPRNITLATNTLVDTWRASTAEADEEDAENPPLPAAA